MNDPIMAAGVAQAQQTGGQVTAEELRRQARAIEADLAWRSAAYGRPTGVEASMAAKAERLNAEADRLESAAKGYCEVRIEVRIHTSMHRGLTLIDKVKVLLDEDGWDPLDVVGWSIDGWGEPWPTKPAASSGDRPLSAPWGSDKGETG